jgi:hypothetical protein
MYFANPTGAALDAMREGRLGYIDTPLQGNRRPPGVTWCADNGCYGKGFDTENWFTWLQKNADDAPRCVFATAPDIVGDAAATMERATQWLPRIRALGYPAALVLQDGQEHHPVPWDDIDAVFIGGTTQWKLGPTPRKLAAEAKARGKWVHCGRVNSYKRLRAMDGCDSVDGTYLTYGPDINLPKLLGWLQRLETQPAMFTLDGCT